MHHLAKTDSEHHSHDNADIPHRWPERHKQNQCSNSLENHPITVLPESPSLESLEGGQTTTLATILLKFLGPSSQCPSRRIEDCSHQLEGEEVFERNVALHLSLASQ